MTAAVRWLDELQQVAQLARLIGVPDARELWGCDGGQIGELLAAMRG